MAATGIVGSRKPELAQAVSITKSICTPASVVQSASKSDPRSMGTIRASSAPASMQAFAAEVNRPTSRPTRVKRCPRANFRARAPPILDEAPKTRICMLAKFWSDQRVAIRRNNDFFSRHRIDQALGVRNSQCFTREKQSYRVVGNIQITQIDICSLAPIEVGVHALEFQPLLRRLIE